MKLTYGKNLNLWKSTLLLLVCLVTGWDYARAQTLVPGDISFVGFNSNLANRDGFAFVPWVTINPGTVIKFTDDGFNTSSTSNGSGNLRDLEQTATWTATSTVSPGTIITIEGNGSSAQMVANVGTVSVTNSDGTAATNLNLGNGGDQVTIHQGSYTSGNSSAATLSVGALYIISWQGISGTFTNWLSTGTTGTATSYLPSDLASYNLFFGSSALAAEYTGPRTGLTIAQYKAAVNNLSNWTLYTTGGVTAYSTTAFSTGTPPSITGQPSNATVCAGSNTSFTVSASNATGYQWQVNTGSGFTNVTDGGVYSGATTATLSITGATAGMNGYAYQVTVTGSATPNAVSNSVTLTVNSAPVITSQPSNATVCVGSSTSFTAAASNATTYKWQLNTGSGFNDITNGGAYSGATTTTLSVTGATLGMAGYQYRMVATGSCSPAAASNAATLSVSGTDTWNGATSSAWGTATNWSCGSIPTASTDVLIPSGTTFSPQVDITSAICNNITINSSAALSFVAGSNVLEVKGNFTNSGTFNATAGKLKLSGTSTQTVPAATYKDFELAGSGTKTASGAINISGVLTLTNGFLQLGTNDITLSGTASIAGANAVLLNATPTSYIITNSTGQMRIQNIGATGKSGAVLFPIGNSTTSYTPLTVTNTGTNDVFGARVIDGVYRSYTAAGVPNGNLQSSYNVNKTWLVTEAVAGGSNATLEFAWALSDQQPSFNNGACFASHFTNGNWQTVFPAQPANGFDPYSLAIANITSFSPFAVGSSGSILPLDLLSFTGKATANGTQLNWNTANEKNLAGFDVERSIDGNTYERIATVAAKGNNSTMENSYSYTDAATPKGTSYYRLKINDYGTEFKYSNTVVISENGTNNYAYTVYPNPADGNDLNIRFSDVLPSGVDVTITDVTGRVWYKASFEAGKSILPVNIKGIPAGIYQVHISNDMINGTTRFTKL